MGKPIQRDREAEVVRRLNAIYGEEESSLDSVIAHLQAKLLSKDGDSNSEQSKMHSRLAPSEVDDFSRDLEKACPEVNQMEIRNPWEIG